MVKSLIPRISGRTKVCALIGDPVDHSLSPSIHNAAFEAMGLDYVYVALRVAPESLSDALYGIRALNFHGLNVTMPHKASVVRYLDGLNDDAKRIGAVNTVLNSKGRLIGYNTDGFGALQALRGKGVEPEGRKIVILGAGGASRAIVYSLSRLSCQVSILNRTPERAEGLVLEFSKGAQARLSWGPLDRESLARELEDADILVNATPLGMRPLDSESPVASRFLRPDLAVFDLVYDPPETRLLKEAKAIGAKVVEGLDMLIFQGAASFEIWTGCRAPIDLMAKVAREALCLGQKGDSRAIGDEVAGH